METWRDTWGESIGLEQPFIQDNHARSEEKGVVRGLHFQNPPYAQSKLIWATHGAIFDVAVDLRRRSPTFGKWHSVVLSAENALRFYVPRGFAHGYMTLEEGTEVQYKVDAYYNPSEESGIRWNDPELAIPWPPLAPILSPKDAALPGIKELQTPFEE